MSKNTKIVLGIVIGVVLLCICICIGAWVAFLITGKAIEESALIEDPVEAQTLAQDIIDYDLPPGYQELGAFNMGIMKMVVINDEGVSTYSVGSPMIMIAEIPFSLVMDEEEMILQIQSNMERSMGNQKFDMIFVGEETATIRGQEVTLLTYEGTSDQGTAMRQVVSSFFEGKSGSVMLMIFGEEAGWDQARVDAFIGSIR
jgi:hypothetical protein